MGRKGVGKRKAGKTKPLSSGKASGSVSPVVVAAESKPVKSFDTGMALLPTKDDRSPSSKAKKKTKKD